MKKIFFTFVWLLAFSAFAYAQAVSYVSNQNELRNAINSTNSGIIYVIGDITFTQDMPEYSNKHIEFIPQNSSYFSTVIDGNGKEGFKFQNSSILFSDSYYSFFSIENFISSSSGAALNLMNSNSETNLVSFTGNKAANGGAVYLNNSTFRGYSPWAYTNVAEENGGVLYAESASTILLFAGEYSNSYLIWINTAGKDGGAFYVKDSTFRAENIDASLNSAGENGGVAYFINTDFAFSGAEFWGNDAGGDGSAVYISSGSRGTFSGAGFYSNRALGNGTVYISSSSNIRFYDVHFSSNTAGKSGTVYAQNAHSLSFARANFNYNTAALSGGALHFDNSTAGFENVFLSENSARTGGGFYLENSTVSYYNSSFRNNNASMFYGGAVYSLNSSFTADRVEFSGNSAAASGGAVYINGASANFSNSSFTNNTSQSDGGALYIYDANAVITETVFSGNKASQKGGAVYLEGTSSLQAELILKGNIMFSNNTMGAVFNDIYLGSYSKLNFDSSGDVALNGGILSDAGAVNIEMKKSGSGKLYLGGINDVKSGFDILSGEVIVQNNAALKTDSLNAASGSSLILNRNSEFKVSGTVTVENGALLSTEHISSFEAGTLNMSGTLKVGVDMFNNSADMIKAETINLDNNTSLLNFGGNLQKGTAVFTIMQSTNAISGTFKDNSGTFGSRVFWDIVYGTDNIAVEMTIKGYGDFAGLTENQQQTADLLDKTYAKAHESDNSFWKNIVSPLDSLGTADLQKTLDRLSGSFYANLLMIPALGYGKNNFFEQINPDEDENNVRVQLIGNFSTIKQDVNTYGDMKNFAYGVKVGWDLYNEDSHKNTKLFGLMIKYIYHDIVQENDNAAINDINLGAYAGCFWENSEFKSSLLLGMQSYEASRQFSISGLRQKISSDFSGFSAGFNNQFAFYADISNNVALKPFAGADFSFASIDDFTEKGQGAELTVDANSYFAGNVFAGIALEFYGKNIEWNINAGAGYLFAGNQNEIKSSFAQGDGKMNIKSAELGEISISAGFGAEVFMTEDINICVNLRYGYSDGYNDIYGNLGVKYRLF